MRHYSFTLIRALAMLLASVVLFFSCQGFAERRVRECSVPGRLLLSDGDNLMVLGESERSVIEIPSNVYESKWAPDGQRIAYRFEKGLRVLDLSQMSIRVVVSVTSPTLYLQSFTWSPEGDRIAFAAIENPSGRGTIYLVSAAGGALTRIAQCAHRCGTPSWSPDGDALYYTSIEIRSRNAPSRTEVLRLDRGQILPVHLFTVPGHFDIVAWSDDQARVALLDRQEKRGLYLADASGQYLQLVDWHVASVAWSPSSNAIVYTKVKQGHGLPTEIRLFEVVSEKRCIVYDPQAHMGKKSPFPMDSRVSVYDWQTETESTSID